MPARGCCIAGWGNRGSVPQGDTSTRRCYGPAKVGGGGGRSQGDMWGRRQGSYLGKGVLLLLDRNPSTNPKVVEGRLVGDKQVEGVPLSRPTQRDQERNGFLHWWGGEGFLEMLGHAMGFASSPRLTTATTQMDLGCGTHALGITQGGRR